MLPGIPIVRTVGIARTKRMPMVHIVGRRAGVCFNLRTYKHVNEFRDARAGGSSRVNIQGSVHVFCAHFTIVLFNFLVVLLLCNNVLNVWRGSLPSPHRTAC